MNRWLKITRPVNGFMGFFSIYIVGFIAVNVHITKFIIPLTLGAISVFLVTAGGNIINDISDLETDRYNHPDRPLPAGTITKKSAYYLALSFFILGFLISIFISLLISTVVILAELLLVSYEFKTKKLGLPGNITISLLIGMIFLYGGFITDMLSKMILLFFLAFFSNMSREIMKDIEDVKGDIDRITLPKRYGIKNAKIVSAAFVVTTIFISFLPYYFHILSIYYLYAVLLDDLLFALTIWYLNANISRGQKVSKVAMIWGMMCFLLGGI
ncbi:MAG TPA: UbiA family prenyltransferase [Ferroplasma sp.]|jgi:geranylgeranylglycerol-phosphate geranylgeranyltransferase|nr:UbiA family prenyltransferase [Ferroplasma sp.]HII82866.1 UbiA family prenyltransferase [Ferroplasma sp.]